MTTEKQILANRKNALQAGVKTDAGKDRVRYNAVKHGLTSKSLLTKYESIDESMDEFEEIYLGLVDCFKPLNRHEHFLVETMAICQFKLRRVEYLEAGFMAENGPEGRKTLYVSHAEDLDIVVRYSRAIESRYYRALRALNDRNIETFKMDLFLQKEVSVGEPRS